MKPINILIVDDEPLAHKVLESHCNKIDFITVVGSCYDGVSAINAINSKKVDAILLDIQMPDLNGLELVESIENTDAPKVIFTSSFTEYAFETFNYEFVVDYLHKPIKLVRFIKSMERLRRILELEQQSKTPHKSNKTSAIDKDFLYIKDGIAQHKINFSEILYLQAYGNYVKYFLKNGDIYLDRQTITNAEKELPNTNFCRIHKSYIVNLNEIHKIVGNQVKLEDLTLPIGKSYKEFFKSKIRNN